MKKEDITALGISEELADKIIGMADEDTKELTKALETEKADRATDVKNLNKTIKDNEATYENEKQTLSGELNALKYANAANAVLNGLEFSSKLAREAAFAKLKEKHPDLSEDGTIAGIDDFLKELKSGHPDAFKSAEPDPKIITGSGGASGKMTKEEFDKLGYEGRTKFFRENPEEYQKLTEQN